MEVSNAKRTIYISGQVAINTDGQIVGVGDIAIQTRQVFENIKSALDTLELQFNDVVKLTFFLTDISNGQLLEIFEINTLTLIIHQQVRNLSKLES